MQTYEIYKNLAWLNELPAREAESVFLDCCGSVEWARRMAASRPFPMLENLFTRSDDIWFALSPADWLEAFAAHPKIGSKRPAKKQKARSADWSADEQSAVSDAEGQVRKDLDNANSLYEAKFGFIFIVCATGKSADEMLAICRARLGTSIETELRIAGAEQNKITALRLNKLLER